MRELSVYYCPQCGRYAYYQIIRNAVCPSCDCKLNLLSAKYLDFIKLNREERDRLISDEILNDEPNICNRILAGERTHNQRTIIAKLSQQVKQLEEENAKLQSTVDWMHAMIWDLIKKNKTVTQQSHPLSSTKQSES